MKFAIRKLAITCVLPTALWPGPLVSDVFAQGMPSANSKLNAGMPQRKPASASKTPPASRPPAANSKPSNQPQYPAAQYRPAVLGTANNIVPPISQVANPGAQQSQSANDGDGQESDVQKQLRLLYEKSGQEMPVMDLGELEVPEPQPGVAPESSPEGQDAGPRSAPQYTAPPAPPQKAPNFFERVFLGKKNPPPRQAPQQSRPPAQPLQLPPPPQTRPGQPNGVPPNGQPATNYRPYQPGQQMPPGQPMQQQLPQGYNGQRPNFPNPQGAVPQPNGYPQQPGPQVQMQRPQGQLPVIPPQPYGQGQPQMQQPQALQPQLQLPAAQRPAVIQQPIQVPLQVPPQYNPPPTGGQSPAIPSQAANVGEDVPFLDDEPEESLEIDLTPKPVVRPEVPAVSVEASRGVIPPPVPTPTASPSLNQTSPTAEAESTAAEENPFSGLKLSIPESAVPVRAAPAAGPALPSPTTPAANATRTPLSTPQAAPSAAQLPAMDDPFLDHEADRKAAAPKTGQSVGAPTTNITTPSAATKTVITPVQPAIVPVFTPTDSAAKVIPGTAAKPINAKPAEKVAGKPVVPVVTDERLKKLAEAPEKFGLKGFCPVALRQKGQLLETKLQFNSAYQGKKFHFSSAAAKIIFEKQPVLFVPVHEGLDGVALIDDEKSLPGSLDQAAWYQGRLYLFANHANLEVFVNDPDGYLDDAEFEQTLSKAVSTPASAKPVPAATPPQKAPAAQVGVAIQPAVKVTPKVPLPDDLPVLSDSLDDLQLTPVTSNSPAPTVNTPAARTPALTPVDAEKAGTQTREAPAPKTGEQPSVPSSTPSGIQMDSPLIKHSTKNTPASFVVPSVPPRSKGTPPRLISPDLRLAPVYRP